MTSTVATWEPFCLAESYDGKIKGRFNFKWSNRPWVLAVTEDYWCRMATKTSTLFSIGSSEWR
jgi:hypothetical protein